MVYKLLQRIPEFTSLPIFELRAMAERAHILCIPKGRWLIYSRQELPAYLYLARGKVETFAPGRILRAHRKSPLTHFYPGCEQARALQPSHILRIDAAQRDFLLSRDIRSTEINVEAGATGLQQFLRTHMMQQIPQHHWRELIDTFTQTSVQAGKEFITQGEPGYECFVVESGHAVIHRQAKTLAHLGPGDFFGEDALVSGARRNASVSALDDMQLHVVKRSVFQHSVLNKLVKFAERPGRGALLNLGRHAHIDAQPFSIAHARDLTRQMDPRQVYYVIGGSAGERALCAFLLVRRGFRAQPVA